MAVSLKHAFTSAVADGADASLVRPSNWNAEHNLTLAADRILGRLSSPGAVEELTGAQILTLSGGAAASHTHVEGDITLGATQRIVGRNTAGGGAAEEVTATQALDWIGSTQGQLLYRDASAWTALAPGTDEFVLGSGGAGANPEWLSPHSFIVPYHTDSSVYNGPHWATTSIAMTANRLYMTPINVPFTRAHTLLAFTLGTLAGSTGIRTGIYNADQTTGKPSTLVVDAGITDSSAGTGSTGLKTVSISQSLARGMYWLAMVSDGAPSVQMAAAGALGIPTSTFAAVVPGAGALIRNLALYRSFTYGALPADESAQTFTLNAASHPWLGIR